MWSSERGSTEAWEGRREKTGRDNEGGIESDEPSSALKLSISSGPRWTNSPQQLLRVDTPAALTDSKVRRFLLFNRFIIYRRRGRRRKSNSFKHF